MSAYLEEVESLKTDTVPLSDLCTMFSTEKDRCKALELNLCPSDPTVLWPLEDSVSGRPPLGEEERPPLPAS